jgi:hypothetical protein
LFEYVCLDNKPILSLKPTKGLQAKKQPNKRVTEAEVEKRHESDIHEDESAGWVEKVQGEKKPYDIPVKVMSIKTPNVFQRSMVGFLSCRKVNCWGAPHVTMQPNFRPCITTLACVKFLQDPQLMENLEKTRRIKKADQSWRLGDPKKKM